MTNLTKPAARPANPRFSSGPCTKRPGWSPKVLEDAVLGRSHRARPGLERIKRAIDLTREVLRVPDTHRIAIVPASDTGAVEMALWSLLGARGVEMLAWESFGAQWVTDVVKQLRLAEARITEAPYGELPDLAAVDFSRDIVFTWNGTTSGVRVPDGDWISATREGLTICDATSAAFAQDLAWDKLDATTFSWQKVMGGEAAHGMLVLGPRAVERLESHTPAWPMPKVFRLTSGGKLNEGVFRGETINTPSLLCVEDYIDALEWGLTLGGLPALMARADANFAVLDRWVAGASWIDFLAVDPANRSNTSVCFKVVDPDVASRPAEVQAAFAKRIAAILEEEGAALDVGQHRDAPAGLRVWCGATVETSDLEALTPWLDWAFAVARSELARAA